MAGFRMHITTSSVLGCGYAGAGIVYGAHVDTCLVAGALCGVSGMLPDLDSDYGVPLRESMCFAAATVPMLLMERFASLGLRHDEMVLLGVSLYLFVRFGVTKLIRKYTVHRGMFHSIPAGLIFAGLAFLICGGQDLEVRYFKAGGVLLGFMSHLVLDEIYSVDLKRLRLKKSFGTALKFWGDDGWANFSTYAKLAVVVVMILGEPAVMERIEIRNPEFARRYQNLQERVSTLGELTGQAADAAARQWADANGSAPQQAATPRDVTPTGPASQPGAAPSGYQPGAAPSQAVIRRDYDPTQRAY